MDRRLYHAVRLPVFVTTGARDPLRVGLALAVLSYWLRHEEADVTVLDWGAAASLRACLGCVGLSSAGRWVEIPEEESQRLRHVYAAKLAAEVRAEFHVVADDDILPRPSCSLAVAVDLMRQRPEIAMASISLPNCAMGGHTREPGGALAETGPVGGARVCRTTFFSGFDFPPISGEYGPTAYDVDLWEGIRGAGGKVGIFGDGAPGCLRATHLAEAPVLSEVWAEFSGGRATRFPAQE